MLPYPYSTEFTLFVTDGDVEGIQFVIKAYIPVQVNLCTSFISIDEEKKWLRDQNIAQLLSREARYHKYSTCSYKSARRTGAKENDDEDKPEEETRIEI